MSSITRRLPEPSTWAGIAVLLSSAAAMLPGSWGPVLQGLANTTAAAAVLLREKGGQ